MYGIMDSICTKRESSQFTKNKNKGKKHQLFICFTLFQNAQPGLLREEGLCHSLILKQLFHSTYVHKRILEIQKAVWEQI